MGGGLVRRRLLDWWHSSRDETSGLRAMAGLTKHPFLAIRMIVDVLFALLFIRWGWESLLHGFMGGQVWSISAALLYAF